MAGELWGWFDADFAWRDVFFKRARNDFLFAMCDGTVYFSSEGRKVNVKPLDVAV